MYEVNQSILDMMTEQDQDSLAAIFSSGRQVRSITFEDEEMSQPIEDETPESYMNHTRGDSLSFEDDE